MELYPNSNSTAEAVLRRECCFSNLRFFLKFKFYCGSGIETIPCQIKQQDIQANSNSTADAGNGQRTTVNRQQVLVLNRIFVYGVKPAALDKSR